MVSFNDQHKVLQAWTAKVTKRVINGEIELTDHLIHGFRLNYNELVEITMRVPLLKLSSVEKRRLERPTPTSRTWCATNCATSRFCFAKSSESLGISPFPMKSGCKDSIFFAFMQINSHKYVKIIAIF